jgi:transketolase
LSKSQFQNPLDLATEARRQILKMTHSAQASHVGSALSIVDVIATIYCKISTISSYPLESDTREVVILSKGHAAASLYSVLALREYFPMEWLSAYCQNGAQLGGHVTAKDVPGVELSTGSLGHGFPYGLGIALSRKMNLKSGKVIVIISDGECDEGTTWESALVANQHNLDNLLVVIDRNRIQSLAGTEETLQLEPLADKWRAFGWDVAEIDGHNHQQINDSLVNNAKPRCIIANTLKGKGVDFMQDTVLWHYKSPNDQELESALSQIEGNHQ